MGVLSGIASVEGEGKIIDVVGVEGDAGEESTEGSETLGKNERSGGNR